MVGRQGEGAERKTRQFNALWEFQRVFYHSHLGPGKHVGDRHSFAQQSLLVLVQVLLSVLFNLSLKQAVTKILLFCDKTTGLFSVHEVWQCTRATPRLGTYRILVCAESPFQALPFVAETWKHCTKR